MNFATFVGPSYPAQAYTADCEQTINLYRETVESAGGKSPSVLLSVPGLTTVAASALTPGRALFAQDGRCFAIVGGTFYELTYNTSTAAWTLTERGAVANDSLPAQIFSGGDACDALGIMAAGSFYTYTLSTNVLSAAVATAGTVNQIGYLDGYFLGLDTSTSTWKIANLLTPSTWDPTQVVQRSDAPDRWTALLVAGQYIWLYGSETTSIFYDAQAFPFPFALVPGAILQTGIAAKFSAAVLMDLPVWLSRSRDGALSIVRASDPRGGTPQRISTHAVENAIAGYSVTTDAVASVRLWQGHYFYQLTFPTAGYTWVYDASTNEWHNRLLWNTTRAVWEAARGQYHCYAFGFHLALDRTVGNIYQESATTYTDASSAPLRRVRRVPFPRLLDTSDFVNCAQLQVLMDIGVGLSTGNGSDPQVMARFSRDGGKTWGNERWTTAGAIGKYLTRVMWNRNGRWRDGLGVLEVVVSDPVPVRLVGAEFEAQRGAA